MKNNKGFTLIELMIVISIIGILAAIAIPQFSKYRARAFTAEGKSLLSPIRMDIADYLDHTGRLPKDNFQCGQAKPEYIKGKYVASVTVNNGMITVLFNGSQDSVKNNYIKLLPIINKDNPTGPIIWDLKHGDLNEIKSEPEKSVSKKKRKKRRS